MRNQFFLGLAILAFLNSCKSTQRGLSQKTKQNNESDTIQLSQSDVDAIQDQEGEWDEPAADGNMHSDKVSSNEVIGGSLRCMLNGQATAFETMKVASTRGSTTHLEATNFDGETLHLFFPAGGKGRMSIDNPDVTIRYSPGSGPNYVAMNGYIVVEETSCQHLKGSFQGNLQPERSGYEGEINVTNGQFSYED